MKKLLVIMLLPLVAAAQSKKPSEDERAFDNAYQLVSDGKQEEALDAYRSFMKTHPKSSLKPRAHFNAAYLAFALGNLTEARDTFLEILDMGYDEREENSLMEPYALYKHNSAVYLAEISLQVKDWDAAKKYIHMFDKIYPYQHFCGNEWAAYHTMKARMDARLFEGQGRNDDAVRALAPHLFGNGLASVAGAQSDLRDLLRRNYSDEEIRKELNSALASSRIIRKKQSISGQITFFGVVIDIDTPSWDDPEITRDGMLELVKENPVFAAFLH